MVLLEACLLAGWVHDLCVTHGVKCLVANGSNALDPRLKRAARLVNDVTGWPTRRAVANADSHETYLLERDGLHPILPEGSPEESCLCYNPHTTCSA